MTKINVLGVDLAKRIFQLHGNDSTGRTVFTQKVTRGKLLKTVSEIDKCVIAMEACSGANYWANEFSKLGHEVKLISPQFVKPFVKANKTDAADAEAIAEAASRPNMRFVSIKQVWQQDIQSIHRVRERLVKNKTALCNEMRGLLAEYGIALSQGAYKLNKEVLFVLADANNNLSDTIRGVIQDLYSELKGLESKVSEYNIRLENISANNDTCTRIEKISGIGTVTSTAILSIIGTDVRNFKNGRQFAAYLGLVPRQSSSGGKINILGISKRGDTYIRTLLVHGARAAIRYAHLKDDRVSKWSTRKEKELGYNKAVVALANKNARIIWALIANETEYKVA
jgi:transposase